VSIPPPPRLVVSAATRLPDSGHVGARARCQDRRLGAAKTKHDVSDADGDWDIGETGAALPGDSRRGRWGSEEEEA